MNAPPETNAPAGRRADVRNADGETAGTVYRDAYHGTMPPNLPPAPRAPYFVAGEVIEAAYQVDVLADRVLAAAHDSCDDATIAELSALAAGIERCACELRAYKVAQGGAA